MRSVLVFLVLYLVVTVVLGCAPTKNEPISAPLEPFQACAMRDLSPADITFPDGIIRKVSVYECSDSCLEYRFVNDESMRLHFCK